MIPSRSGRRLPREVSRSLRPLHDQLLLPWLCPALYTTPRAQSRPRIQQRGTANAAKQRPLPPARAHTSPASTLQKLQQDRKYAHAASPTLQGTSHDDFYIPIVPESSPSSNAWIQMPQDMNFFDGSNPLMIDENIKSRHERYRKVYRSLPVNDLRTAHQTLEACLTVGFYPRAAATLRSLNEMYRPEMEEIVGLNNFYIGHMLGLHINTGDLNILSEVTKWYHVDMLKQGIQPNASTYALMLQVVMRDPDRGRAARSVRRYSNEASQAGLIGLVLDELQSVVPSEEYKQLAEMAPGIFGDSVSIVEEAELNDARMDEKRNTQGTVAEADPALPNGALAAGADATGGLPYVMSTAQKGSGLEALRQSLSSFVDPETQTAGSQRAEFVDSATYEVNLRRQIQLEEDASLAAIRKWQDDMQDVVKRGGEIPVLKTRSARTLIRKWHERLVPLLDEKFQKPEEPMQKDAHGEEKVRLKSDLLDHQPYLAMLDPERVSVTAITSVLHTLASDRSYEWVPVVRICLNLGRAVEKEGAKQWVEARKLNRFVKANAKRQMNQRTRDPSSAKGIYRNLRHFVPDGEVPQEWTKNTQVRVGASILECLLKVATLDPKPDFQAGTDAVKATAALSHKVAFMKGRKLGVIVADPELISVLTASPHAALLTKSLPMLVPPKPWTGYSEGGYMKQKIPVIRLQTECFQSHEYVKVAIEQGDMDNALKGLDTLGRVPWKVNRDVFDVLLKVWNTGDAFAKIPAVEPVLDVPEPPSPDAPKMAKIKHYRAMQAYNNKIDGYHSERCYQNFQIETARAYLNDVFYLPHNIDFRGRAYPLPPYFNQMGSDNARGLLKFAQGKELGTRGLRWLKIHLANLYGYDKASLDERLAFAEEHLKDAIDSADKPLDGQGWWKKAEKPWQCLAACFELRDAHRLADPTKHVSCLPVHQDGTCNGLQHYAALGGDEIGARQVNLEPGERPSDIYTAVANHVRASVVKDADNGDENALHLKDYITRKVVKQPVMTSVYGVTHRGAQKQIAKQLDVLIPSELLLATNNRYRFSSYLATKTFEALDAIFNGAAAIQRWLGECADGICQSVTPAQVDALRALFTVEPSSKGLSVSATVTSDEATLRNRKTVISDQTNLRTSVIWTTPLRIPVVQPYRKEAAQRIPTELQTINLLSYNSSSTVDKRKQLQAFAPNYIHSLDATHMLLSAQRCEEAGLMFSAVHDSFWTHATDVDTMNVVLRNAFVQMHSEDIVGRLASEFKTRYANHFRRQRVKRYSPLGKRIFALRKKISVTKNADRDAAELVLESERQRLLSSDDPRLRSQGESMMTPGRICAEADPSDWELPADFKPRVRKSKKAPENGAGKASADAELRLSDEFDAEIECAIPAEQLEQELTGGAWSTEARDLESAAQLEIRDRDDDEIPDDTEVPDGYVDLSKHLRKKKTPARQESYLDVWMPLEFPAVPVKGQWDIARLRESEYFFS